MTYQELTTGESQEVDSLKANGEREWIAVAMVIGIDPNSDFTIETKGTASNPQYGYIVRFN